MNSQKNKLNILFFILLYLGISCLSSQFVFAQNENGGSDAPEMEVFKAEIDPNPPPEKSQDEIKSMFAPIRITPDLKLGLEEYKSRKEELQKVKVYSAQWVAYVKKQNEDLEKAQLKKYELDKEYKKNRTETVVAYKEEHKNMEEEKKYTEEVSAEKNKKKDGKKEVAKNKVAKKRETEDLKLKKKYAADPEKLKTKQDELQLKRDAEDEKKKSKEGLVLEKFNQRKKNNPLVVQEKIDNLDQNFDKVVDSLDSQYQRRSQDIDEQIAQLEAENSEEMKKYKEIQELDYNIRLSIGLAIKGVDEIHNQYGKKVDKQLEGLTVSKFYNEETGEIVNQPFLDELVGNIFYTDRKIDVESVSVSRLISNYEEYGIEGKQGAVGYRINLDKDYVLMLLHLQVDGKKALLFKKTDIKEANDLLKEQEIANRERIKYDYQVWLEQRNKQHEEQLQKLTTEYDNITANLFEEEDPKLLFDKITRYIILRRKVKHQQKLILADDSSEEKLERINNLSGSIKESMTYAATHINKLENEKQKDINRTLSEINNKLVSTHTSDIYDVETQQFTDTEFIELLKENIFFSSVPPNIETSMISRIVPNPEQYGINPLTPATGYRINLDNEYDLLILKLESGEKKAVILKRQELDIISTLAQDALNIRLAQDAENKTAEEQAIDQNLQELYQRLANLNLTEIYDTETEKFIDTEFIEKLKSNIFYSQTETNISTSGIGKIVPNAQKYGMDPRMAAKGYRFNIDPNYDLVVVKLENGQREALVLNRNELPTISTVEREQLNLHLAKTAQADDEREQVIEKNLQDLDKRLANLTLAEIYNEETDEFTDTEFIEKLKANIFYSQAKENINTSGVGRIVPNASKYGINPKMAAKGYRFNIDSEHDLMVLKLENDQTEVLVLNRNELSTISTAERDELHLHLAKTAQAHDEREQVIEQNLQELDKRLANLVLSDIYSVETDKFTDTEFIEKLKANIFYSQAKENINTSGVGRIVPNAQKYGMNPKMAAKGYRFNIDSEHDLIVLKLENNHIQALIHQRNELEQTSTLERDQLHLHLAKTEQTKHEGEQAIEQNLQELSKRFKDLKLADIYDAETDKFTDTEFIEKLKANIFYSQAKENINTSGVGRIVPNASKYGMNPKMAAKGYRFNIDSEHDLMVLKLENNHIQALIHERNELEQTSTLERDQLHLHLAKSEQAKHEGEQAIEQNLQELSKRFRGLQLADIYDAETDKFTDTEFIEKLKANIFYSQAKENIHTSGVGRIVPNASKYGMNPKMAAKGYRFNIDPKHDLMVLKLENNHIQALIHERNELEQTSTLERDQLHLHLAKTEQAKHEGEQAIEQNLQELSEKFRGLQLADIYDAETDKFTDTEFIEKLKANIFYSQAKENINTSGVGRVVPNASKYGMNPKMAAKGYRFNIDSEHDLMVLKLENNHIQALIHERNELEEASTLERDQLHLHLAKKEQVKHEGEQAIEQNLQELSKRFRGLQLADIYDEQTDEFTDTEFIKKLEANIFYSQAKENIHTSGVGKIVPNAQKYGMNPKMSAKGYRFNIDSKHDLLILKLENHEIYTVVHKRNELEEQSMPQNISYWNIDEHYLAQKQDSSNRAFLVEARSTHQSLEMQKNDSLDLEQFEAKINDLSLLQHQLKKKITENNQSAWAMPSVKPLDSLRGVVAKQVSIASKKLSDLQNERSHKAEADLSTKIELSKIYDKEKKEFLDLDYLKELGNSVFYSKKSPSIETTGLGKVLPDVALYGVNPKIRAIGHRMNINPSYDLIIVKMETGTKYAIIWDKINFKTIDAWNLNL